MIRIDKEMNKGILTVCRMHLYLNGCVFICPFIHLVSIHGILLGTRHLLTRDESGKT